MMNTISFRCTVCEKDFSTSSNLRKHIKNLHPDKFEEKSLQCGAICHVCSQSFLNNSNLTKHIKKFHPDEVKSNIHECNICQERFTNLQHLQGHMKNHDEDFQCILCKHNLEMQFFGKKSVLYEHFEEKHGIRMITEILQFISFEEFEIWKKEEENEIKQLFVQYCGAQTSSKVYYTCHRSGYYRGKGSGLRHLKTQGSKKIDGFCPARMLLKITDGKCEVEYIKTHIGHSNDLGHLTLTAGERQALAVQIASKIPFEAILDQVRESLCDTNLERSHLLTKKDLHNIEQSFNLNNESRRHEDDAISVDAWVTEMQDSGCVLFYKPQGEVCEYAQLKADDFALIIMNQGQIEMLEKYGHDCLCIDGTHGLNAYLFELTSVLVLDDMREGFPCCFLISNRTDEEMMYILFTCIKNKLGRSLQSKVFMSDMAPSFYNAWIRVMDLPLYRLYCTWHTDRAWRNNLTKVKSKEKQVVVYKQLRTLLQERDRGVFAEMIPNFVSSMLSDPDTTEFGQYFQVHYIKNDEAWAYCHRINCGINTNMHIESMHRIIKYIYLNGKVNKRLDKAIHVLMQFVRDKLFSRLIVLHKGKISAKLKDLRVRHKTSLNLNRNSVLKSEIGWMVPSSSSQELYRIEEKQSHCECKLVCTDCQVCIHRYTCSCLDSCIRWNMCKHIHLLVCQFLKLNEDVDVGNSQLSQYLDGNPDLTIDENVCNKEELQIVKALTATKMNFNQDQFSVELEKAKLEVLQLYNSCKSFEGLNALKRFIAPMRSSLEVAEKSKSVELCEELPKKISHNQNIDKQRRLYKTKKTNKKRKVQVLEPDTQEAKIEIVLNDVTDSE